jgi:hypothetical protein
LVAAKEISRLESSLSVAKAAARNSNRVRFMGSNGILKTKPDSRRTYLPPADGRRV